MFCQPSGPSLTGAFVETKPVVLGMCVTREELKVAGGMRVRRALREAREWLVMSVLGMCA